MTLQQLDLFGRTKQEKEQEERDNNQKEFFKEQIEQLKEVRTKIIENEYDTEKDEDGDYDFTFVSEVLSCWWYCNHIQGWNNNVPCEKELYCGSAYDDVPQNAFLANCIRDCHLCVTRDGVIWDKEFALIRIEKAIEEYEKELKKWI